MQRIFYFLFMLSARPPYGANMKHLSFGNKRIPTKTLVFTAVMTALVTAATVLLGAGTGDFYFNCGDTVIFVTAAMFGPLPAAVAGGLGSFFADLAVYPATMFFTLFIKGFEGLICGLIMRAFSSTAKPLFSAAGGLLSMIVSGVFMMTGYYVCNRFFYGTAASALAALPADAVQATVSSALAFTLLYVLRLIKLKEKYSLSTSQKTGEAYVRVTRTEKSEETSFIPHEASPDGNNARQDEEKPL